jgi:hypothetical protein
MPRVGFEPTIPAFEWAKTVHDLDRAATVIGIINIRTEDNYTSECVSAERQAGPISSVILLRTVKSFTQY